MPGEAPAAVPVAGSVPPTAAATAAGAPAPVAAAVPAAPPAAAPHAGQMSLEAGLALQMMNVAAQLLRSKGDPGDAEAAAAAQAAAAAAASLGAGGAARAAASGCGDGADAPAGQIGFKPRAAQVEAYGGAAQGFSFPPNGPMPLGWPPASMVDESLDSKLRPPAA